MKPIHQYKYSKYKYFAHFFNKFGEPIKIPIIKFSIDIIKKNYKKYLSSITQIKNDYTTIGNLCNITYKVIYSNNNANYLLRETIEKEYSKDRNPLIYNLLECVITGKQDIKGIAKTRMTKIKNIQVKKITEEYVMNRVRRFKIERAYEFLDKLVCENESDKEIKIKAWEYLVKKRGAKIMR